METQPALHCRTDVDGSAAYSISELGVNQRLTKPPGEDLTPGSGGSGDGGRQLARKRLGTPAG